MPPLQIRLDLDQATCLNYMLVSSLSSTTPTDFGELATELLSAWGDCGGVLPILAVPKPLPRLLPNREIMAAALRSPPRLACSARRGMRCQGQALMLQTATRLLMVPSEFEPFLRFHSAAVMHQ